MASNFPDMINNIQAQLDSMGPGPHTDAQREKIKSLQLLLAKAQQENQKTPMPGSNPVIYQQQQPKPTVAASSAVNNVLSVDPVNTDLQASGQSSTHKILDRTRLQDLVKEIDPMAQLEDDVEEILMQIADDFIENVVSSSCDIAKHRHSDILEAKDVQLYLDRAWNIWVPGFGTDELRPYKRAPATEAHKQRLALIKKALKKS